MKHFRPDCELESPQQDHPCRNAPRADAEQQFQLGNGIFDLSGVEHGVDRHGRKGLVGNDYPAGGDLAINASISDGFSSAANTATLGSDASFSYGFEAGGDVAVGAGRIVRTGTGDIRIEAGRDIRFESAASTIYTAGRATDTRAGFVRTNAHGDYPTMGGDIRLAAARDIVSPVINQSSAAWLFRGGATDWSGDPGSSTVAEQTSWSIVFRNFQSGIGALGGGNVAVRAGRDVQDLSVAIPSTGHLATAVGQRANPADLEVRGGGDLTLTTGRDLLGSIFHLGLGEGEIGVGRNVAGGAPAPMRTSFNLNSPVFAARSVNLLLGLSDARVAIEAIGDVAIEAAYDPMFLPQIAENLIGTNGAAWDSRSDRSGVWATALSGDLTFWNYSLAAGDLSRGGSFAAIQTNLPTSDIRERLFGRSRTAPSTLSFASLSGSMALLDRFNLTTSDASLELAPSPKGNIELLAAEDLNLRVPIIMRDQAAAYRRNALAPILTTANNVYLQLGIDTELPSALNASNNFERGFVPLHAGDLTPARLVALSGSIENLALPGSSRWSFTAPKHLVAFAGTDIGLSTVVIQHNDVTAVSSVTAGRDVLSPNISFLGQGLLTVEAGRSVSFLTHNTLLNRGGIVSGGNSLPFGETPSTSVNAVNLALPDIGGDIQVMAGTAEGAGYDAFAALYLDPANRANPALPLAHPDNAGKVVHTYEAELIEYLAELGFAEVSAENRLALFGSLSAPSRQAFLNRVLFSELRETGIDYNDANGPRFQQNLRGYSAIDLLFPNATDTPGEGVIDLKGGIVQSFAGGDISLLAPYGAVTIGFPNEAENNQGRGGVVTRRGGDISILADRNIALETSRVFTLQGGDILMWTSNGDITAGAGAKTSVFNVPLRFRMANDGDISVDVFGLSTGAGIGVLDALQGEDEEREPSRLDLVAFRGEVNAGDAGIRVVGDINIAALRVVNAANIEVSGEAVGIPQVPVVNVGALTAASAATSAIINEASQLAQRAQPQMRTEVPTILSVRFLGFGD